MEEDILRRWTECIGDLLDDASDILDFDRDEELSGNKILESEVEAALNEMKSEKDQEMTKSLQNCNCMHRY